MACMQLRLAVLLLAVGLLGQQGHADEVSRREVSLERGITFEAGEKIVRSLAWSPDGTKLAAGCSDRTLRLWTGRDPKPFASVTLDRYG